MEKLEEITLGVLVAQNYQAAEVFRKYGIDYCCQGNRTLLQAVEEAKLDPEVILSELIQLLKEEKKEGIDYQKWPIDLLADFIQKKHHRYVEEKIPVINQYLDKIESVHGAAHPELKEINRLFKETSGELAMHMKKEELVLFPFIRKMVEAQSTSEMVVASPVFGTVQNPIAMMQHEHSEEGERFRTIARLSNEYTPPDDACGSYKVAYALLKEFEEDLHLHIHLENNILFPGAIQMEAKVTEPIG
jgi:regulator of cell morphogenesis and NO signaling